MLQYKLIIIRLSFVF